MGEKYFSQPLTKGDKISVILYRAGIGLSAVIISIFAYMLFSAYRYQNYPVSSLKFNILVISLYIAVGISVFSIHLYVSKYKRTLKRFYYLSVVALIVLFMVGKGDILGVLAHKPHSPILFIPLSGCLGFITAKEAFCFKLMEGYLLALIMPLYLFLFSIGFMTMRGASYGLILIALLLIFFTFRKVFMPIHYDIGDKSAYT